MSDSFQAQMDFSQWRRDEQSGLPYAVRACLTLFTKNLWKPQVRIRRLNHLVSLERPLLHSPPPPTSSLHTHFSGLKDYLPPTQLTGVQIKGLLMGPSLLAHLLLIRFAELRWGVFPSLTLPWIPSVIQDAHYSCRPRSWNSSGKDHTRGVLFGTCTW
jgi:hypothetical protein